MSDLSDDSLDDFVLRDIPPMGAALAVLEQELVYNEAKMQHEALIGNGDVRATRGQGDISRYYRDKFDRATNNLEEAHKRLFLTVCFAYKTVANVLYFLDLFHGHEHPWISAFKTITKAHGKDSNFSDTAIEGVTLETRCEPYFIVSTLPLAFPSEFFTALSTLGPYEALKSANLLRYPSALLLANSASVNALLSANLAHFSERTPLPESVLDPADQTTPATSGDKWSAFFNHLLGYRARGLLILPDGNELAMDDGTGYDEADYEMFCAAWRAQRQMAGLREKGQALRLMLQLGVQSGIRTSLSATDAPDVADADAAVATEADEDGGDSEMQLEPGARGGYQKRVRWNDEAAKERK
ncbi:hypothetical protein BDV95DRAFT_4827 [Massariosphaeria phaeospora]|uniref:Uncharacterized protein n=1 Tax=Massariosphaeria phaeospora TaxID=100035 RepID=A0A7C8MKM6_9PLEO|nr:hypothetical protein BDV95DRAFT_4827 [Massariosphaeria phaeospora]